MAKKTGYDSGLTTRLEAALREVGSGSGDSGSAAGPRGAPSAAVESASSDQAIPSLLGEVLPELVEWSRRLDSESDPNRLFALAQAAALRSQSVAERARLLLSTSPLESRFGGALSELLTHLTGLTRNALARMEEFAHGLGVESFSVTITSTPPGVSVTFTFGHG